MVSEGGQGAESAGVFLLLGGELQVNTLRTGDADLGFYNTTVQDG